MRFMAVKIEKDFYGVKFGSFNEEVMTFFKGQEARDYATNYAELQNKLHGLKI